MGYGGNLDPESYTALLSYLISSHKRTVGSAQDYLHCYTASFLWDKKSKDSDLIDANFMKIELTDDDENPNLSQESCGVSDDLWVRTSFALELSKMRRAMADDNVAQNLSVKSTACNARIIVGGKEEPETENDDSGFAGVFPGQAEEALRHLQQEKPIYVVGGFYGQPISWPELSRERINWMYWSKRQNHIFPEIITIAISFNCTKSVAKSYLMIRTTSPISGKKSVSLEKGSSTLWIKIPNGRTTGSVRKKTFNCLKPLSRIKYRV